MKLNGISWGDQFTFALEAQDGEQAAQRFELLVAYQMGALVANGEKKNVREEAVLIVMANLGYMAGYYDLKTREKIERLYDATHPVIGAVSSTPSDKEIFELGQNLVTSPGKDD